MRFPTTALLLAFGARTLCGQELIPEQKQQVDTAIPKKAPAKPKKHRRMLVTNLSMRDGRPFPGSSNATIPIANYSIGLMGKRTGAYEAVFSNDIEMFRPDKIKQFDAICFLNTVGVLFDDAELRKSLLDFIASERASLEYTTLLRRSYSIQSMTNGHPSAKCSARRKTEDTHGMEKR